VLIPYFDPSRLHDYLRIAAQVRRAGIGVELYPEAKKLGAQLKYANRRGYRVALVAGEDELNAGNCQIKDMTTGQSTTVSLANDAQQLIAELRQLLATG